MTDLLTRLTQCHRPNLLISAARIGSLEYARKQALSRILGIDEAIGHGAALQAFMDVEGELDDMRRAHDASYSVARHVEVLVAVMGEAHLLSAESQPQQVNSSQTKEGPAKPIREPGALELV